MKELEKIDSLRWVRIFTPVHIPSYLIDQIRDKDYTKEDFYKFQEQSCLRMTKEGPTLNPFNHLYVLSDENNITKGFVWFTVDALSKDICIHTFSIDKEYWFRGRAVEKLSTFIKEIRKNANLNKVYWITNYPKHSQYYGFKRSKSVLMEFTEKQDGKDAFRGSNARGERKPSDSRTTTIPRGNISASARTTSKPSIQPVSTAL